MSKKLWSAVGLLLLRAHGVRAQGAGSAPPATSIGSGAAGQATIDAIPGMIQARVQPWIDSPVWISILIASLMVMAVVHWQGTGRLAEIGIRICIAAAIVGGAGTLVGMAAGTA